MRKTENIRQGYFEKKIADKDLKEIKDKYIYGEMIDGRKIFRTLDELVDIYNENVDSENQISKKTIYNLSSKEKWTNRKTIIINKLDQQKEEKELRQILAVSSNLEAVALENITKAHKVISLYLENYSDIFGDEYQSPFSNLNIEELPQINAKDLSMLVGSIEKLLNIQYKILGEDDFKNTVYKEIKELEKSNQNNENKELIDTLKGQLAELELEEKKSKSFSSSKYRGRKSVSFNSDF